MVEQLMIRKRKKRDTGRLGKPASSVLRSMPLSLRTVYTKKIVTTQLTRL